MSEKQSMKSLEGVDVSEIYRNRRKRLMEKIDSGVALINSSGLEMRMLYDRNMQYLTGLNNKDAFLLLVPQGFPVNVVETLLGPELGRGRMVQEVLFMKEPELYAKKAFGMNLNLDDLSEVTGVETVFPLSKLDEVLQTALMQEDVLWLNTPVGGWLFPTKIDASEWIDNLRRRYYWIQFKNIAPSIIEMRRVKEPYEIECLRRAYEFETEIFIKIMQRLKPGENESLGESIFIDAIKSKGPDYGFGIGDDYPAHIVVASGKYSSIVAYFGNRKDINAGDLVLIDSGVTYRGYSSDITRTFPASGKFSNRQKELYSIVLEAQEKAISAMKPGATLLEAHQIIYEHYKEHNLENYIGHGHPGHYVGLTIHDATTGGGYDLPLEPNVMLSLEPMLMLPDEEIGIRIEDGILITENGCQVMPGPPKEIEEVEKLCAC